MKTLVEYIILSDERFNYTTILQKLKKKIIGPK